MSARDEILRRIKASLADLPDRDRTDEAIDWTYGQPTAMDDVIGTFIDRCADYKARVEKVPESRVRATITSVLESLGVASAVVPDGLDASWRQGVLDAKAEIRADQPAMTARQLNDVGAAVTGAKVGIAETGTIVLDHGPDQGRRALTLVPDIHVCVVRTDQVVSDVPEAITRLRPSIEQGQPLTWVSGPSATSDIELSRVEGVHGPRTLVIIVAQ
ncbi:MAG: lactate utilization protein C [Propionibacteriaceae bacterium]|jgi:L-lactate dehydrogenase complex protein LldG|nr:lactate utilization protein C [Propionibacteriaceae bacterium]